MGHNFPSYCTYRSLANGLIEVDVVIINKSIQKSHKSAKKDFYNLKYN